MEEFISKENITYHDKIAIPVEGNSYLWNNGIIKLYKNNGIVVCKQFVPQLVGTEINYDIFYIPGIFSSPLSEFFRYSLLISPHPCFIRRDQFHIVFYSWKRQRVEMLTCTYAINSVGDKVKGFSIYPRVDDMADTLEEYTSDPDVQHYIDQFSEEFINKEFEQMK